MVSIVRWLAILTSPISSESLSFAENKMTKSINLVENNAQNGMTSTRAKNCYIETSYVCLSPGIINAIAPPNIIETNKETTVLWIKTTGELRQQEKSSKNQRALMERKTNQQCLDALWDEKEVIAKLIIQKNFVCAGLQAIINEVQEIDVFYVSDSDGELFAAKPEIQQISSRQCHSMTSDNINKKIEECKKHVQDFKENNLYGSPEEIEENKKIIQGLEDDLNMLKILTTESDEKTDDILASLRRNCANDNQDISLAHGNSATLTFKAFLQLITRLNGYLQALKT